jgi:hypothetical protein
MMFNRKNMTKNYNVYDFLQELKNKDDNQNMKKIEKIDDSIKKDDTIDKDYIEKNKINIPKKLKVIGKII